MIIINAAAFTAVDKAEQEVENAYAVNASGALHIAEAARKYSCQLVHISTDFVFDGRKSSPYLPKDKPNPLGVYGKSKLEGEQRVRGVLGKEALILRTAWLYSAHGNNFVKTMLRLMQERDYVSVVTDQVGTPCWARGLAETIWNLVQRKAKGILHWTDAGVASWYDFAVAIQEEALTVGILEKMIPIRPINTQDYLTPAPRPGYSVLDKTATWKVMQNNEPLHWRANLRYMLKELKGL